MAALENLPEPKKRARSAQKQGAHSTGAMRGAWKDDQGDARRCRGRSPSVLPGSIHPQKWRKFRLWSWHKAAVLLLHTPQFREADSALSSHLSWRGMWDRQGAVMKSYAPVVHRMDCEPKENFQGPITAFEASWLRSLSTWSRHFERQICRCPA